MKNNFKKTVLLLVFIVTIFFFDLKSISASDKNTRVYPIVPKLNVRAKASINSKLIYKIRYGRWVNVIKKQNNWIKIELDNKKTGFVLAKLVSDKWIMVLKKERKIILKKGRKNILSFNIGLGFNPVTDKIKLGGGCTPEGRFYICETNRNPRPHGTYGYASLRISYPNIEDARRGLQNKLINMKQYRSIVTAINKGKMPPQNTILGSSIKIHGGDPGSDSDWTLGCIAVKNTELKQIVAQIPKQMAIVEVYKSKKQSEIFNSDGYVNKKILERALELVKKGCVYTRDATAIIPLTYPMGDLDRSKGVCTDLVIRSLRVLNIDLQALLYEDIILNPGRYRNISNPNANIDHRRTRNLKKYFDLNARILTNKTPKEVPGEWKAGDIVLMDTGVNNGTIYDHIGIVSNRKIDGIPLVINLWAIGSVLNEMELLRGEYPKIVGHYRMLHPFYYDAYK